MSGSLNKVTLIGHLGDKPKIHFTKDGKKPIANLSLATSESWLDKRSGEKAQRTEWHRVVIFAEGLAKVAEKYLRKGSKVYVEGELRTRKWQDNEGVDRYTTEIVLQGYNARLIMLDGAKKNGEGEEPDTGDAPDTIDGAEDGEIPF